MTTDIQNQLNRLERKLTDPLFRQNSGRSNEVGHYVFDYDPRDELIVRNAVGDMQRRITYDRNGFTLTIFDLYDIIIDELNKEGFLESCYVLEKDSGFEVLSDAIAHYLGFGEPSGAVETYIKNHTQRDTIIILCGIGKCYPILRSHKLLNDLHQVLDNVPVVLMYPGKYDEQKLSLLGKIKDGNYYRAFRLLD